MLFADRDRDGHTAQADARLCVGAAVPEPYREVASGNDCDDTSASLYRWLVLYRDLDGDGVGAPPRSVPCLGATIPAGWSARGYDVADGDPTVQWREAEDELLELVLH